MRVVQDSFAFELNPNEPLLQPDLVNYMLLCHKRLQTTLCHTIFLLWVFYLISKVSIKKLMLLRVVYLAGVCLGCVCLSDQAGSSAS